jgi:hypothetical protein
VLLATPSADRYALCCSLRALLFANSLGESFFEIRALQSLGEMLCGTIGYTLQFSAVPESSASSIHYCLSFSKKYLSKNQRFF